MAVPRNTIDSEHARAESLLQTLASKEAIPPRELRRIWETRQRPFWRLKRDIYRHLARRLTGAGENYLAIDVVSEGKAFFGNEPGLIFHEALASARSGSVERARELLLTHHEIARSVADAAALLARLYKDAWKATGRTEYLQAAFDKYFEAYKSWLSPAFTGTNAASMALLLDDKRVSGELATAVLEGLVSGQLTQGDPYWDIVTQAECQLDLGRIPEARASYAAAANLPGVPQASLLTARAQARLLLPCHGYSPRLFDDCFRIPLIACFTGHRIDEAGRGVPRFPASRESAVKEAIETTLRDRNVRIGFSAAANGGDLLFVEALQASGGETFIYLPMRQTDFKNRSVDAEGTGWGQRFEKALASADAVYELSPPTGMSVGEIFEYGNRVCFGAALRRARESDTDLIVVAVWDGQSGQQGGTGEFVRLAMERKCEVIVIDPLKSPTTSSLSISPPEHPFENQWPIRSLMTLWLSSHEHEAALKELIDQYGASVVHVSLEGTCVSLLIDGVSTAADFAWTILEAASNHILALSSAIGLHAGPVRTTRSILTGQISPEGTHISEAAALARIEPSGYIYASTEFVSLAEVDGIKAVRFEYLGQRRIEEELYPRMVFRMVRE